MAGTSGGSDDRIDIEINDKISSAVPTKLLAIATNADKGATSVQRLKAELASISDTPTARLKAATDGITNSLNKELDAQKTLKQTVDTTTAALDKETAAQDRLSKMIDASIAKYNLQRKAAQDAYAASLARSNSAGLAGAAQGAGAAAGAGEGALAAEAGAIGAGVATATKEAETALVELEAKSTPILTRFKNAVAGAFDFTRDAIAYKAGQFKGFFGAGGAAEVEKEAGAVSKLGHAAATNSTAIREMFVLAREGSVGNFTRMAGSASILASSLGLLHSVLIPLVIVLGTAAAGMKLFESTIRSDADPQLRAYANSLGLTEKEMRKLHNTTVDAKGKLKEFDATALTMGDTFRGFIDTVKEGLAGFGNDTKKQLDHLGVNWGAAWTGIGNFVRNVVIGFYGLVQGLVAWIETTIANCVKIIANVGMAIASAAAEAIVGVINAGVNSINYLADKSNSFFHTSFGHMEQWHADAPKYFSLQGVDIGGEVNAGIREADATLKGFSAKWRQNSINEGKERIKQAADAIIANRNPKKQHEPKKDQGDFINDENKKLDDQIRRMTMLKDAREEQQQLDQIEEAFVKRRMPLDEAQIAAFRKKIVAINDYKYVQAELDRIYEDGITPQRTYNSTVAAAADLLHRGAISAAQYAYELGQAQLKLDATKDLVGANAALRTYNDTLSKAAYSLAQGGITQTQFAEAVARAKREYQTAIDPLFAMNETVEAGMKVAHAYGIEVDRANYLESIRQAYAAKGKSIIDANTGALTAEVAALVKKNDALRDQQFIQSAVGDIVNPILDLNRTVAMKQQMYNELNRMADAFNLKEGQRKQALAALDAKFSEIRLKGASTFFGELAALSSSGNKKIAAIGKAAAAAQATIDGFVAVQKALASEPPPWNFALAAAVAIKTGAQVAGIMSTNVGSFDAGTDFMVGGRHGVDQNNINMNVSRGERVIVQTPQQQREAARGGKGDVTVPVKVVNIHDPSEIPAAMAGEDGERVIMNIIRRNAKGVNKMLQGS